MNDATDFDLRGLHFYVFFFDEERSAREGFVVVGLLEELLTIGGDPLLETKHVVGLGGKEAQSSIVETLCSTNEVGLFFNGGLKEVGFENGAFVDQELVRLEDKEGEDQEGLVFQFDLGHLGTGRKEVVLADCGEITGQVTFVLQEGKVTGRGHLNDFVVLELDPHFRTLQVDLSLLQKQLGHRHFGVGQVTFFTDDVQTNLIGEGTEVHYQLPDLEKQDLDAEVLHLRVDQLELINEHVVLFSGQEEVYVQVFERQVVQFVGEGELQLVFFLYVFVLNLLVFQVETQHCVFLEFQVEKA